MNLLGKKPVDPRARRVPDKPRISIGALFNPGVGASMRPLAETTRIFVTLLASIFAANGLFPRNHPALLGNETASITLGEVLSTGWSNVSFRRDRLPQTAIFFATIVSLVFSALAVLIALLLAVSGHAHAAAASGCSGGPFEPCDATQDIANGWMNYIFFGKPMMNYLDQLGQVVPQSSVIQDALIAALGFYSDAILIIAALVLFYYLVSMVVETAHHGVVMGKRANQVWAPIRLVVAIGLLVPISGGLNSGQYIMVQIAKWGSNLATQTWSIFLQELVQSDSKYVMPNVPYARRVVADVVRMEACAEAYNRYRGEQDASAEDGNIPVPPSSSQTETGGAKTYWYEPGHAKTDDHGLCGSYTMPAATTSAGTSYEQNLQQTVIPTVRQSAFDQMQQQAHQFALSYVRPMLPETVGGTLGSPLPANNGEFENLVASYQDALQTQFEQMAASGNEMGNDMQQIAQTSGAQGWVTAGAWFNTISRIQGALTEASQQLFPQTTAPNASNIHSFESRTHSAEYNALKTVGYLDDWLAAESPNGAAQVTAQRNQKLLASAASSIQRAGDPNLPDSMMEKLFEFIDWLATWNGVWKADANNSFASNDQKVNNGNQGGLTGNPAHDFSLGVQFHGADPLAEIAGLGHANINVAYKLFDDFVLMMMASSSASDAGKAIVSIFGARAGTSLLGLFIGGPMQLVGQAGMAIGQLLGMMTVVFFTAGFMLAYFLPLIPFIRFIFGILSWFLSVLEAIVCMPLVALAHLNPEGDGLPGASAKTAYYFIFNIFLRPVLMVFGLILGLILFFVIASAMNMMYATAAVGTGGVSHGHVALARVVYSILYVVILYLCANNAFKMIEWLPDHCIKWMGGQSLQHAQMGDPAQIGQMMGLASGYVEQRVVGATGEALKAAGPLALGAMWADPKGKEWLTSRVNALRGQLGAAVPSANDPVFGAFQGDTDRLHGLSPGGSQNANDHYALEQTGTDSEGHNNGGHGMTGVTQDYQAWHGQSGNENKTPQDFMNSSEGKESFRRNMDLPSDRWVTTGGSVNSRVAQDFTAAVGPEAPATPPATQPPHPPPGT